MNDPIHLPRKPSRNLIMLMPDDSGKMRAAVLKQDDAWKRDYSQAIPSTPPGTKLPFRVSLPDGTVINL